MLSSPEKTGAAVIFRKVVLQSIKPLSGKRDGRNHDFYPGVREKLHVRIDRIYRHEGFSRTGCNLSNAAEIVLFPGCYTFTLPGMQFHLFSSSKTCYLIC